MELKKLKLTIHPLFFISGIYFAIIGKVYSFLIYTITALIHEFGHYVKAEKLGYMLKKVQLMPYGAVISGDLSGLKIRDEILIALFGPLVNFCVGVGFLALWWIIPTSYPFTEEIVFASFSICLINLFPFYPLDGGRILNASLRKICSPKRAIKICKMVSLVACVLLIVLFIHTIVIGAVNVTLIFFAFFIFAGAFMAKAENSYVKIFSNFTPSKLSRGVIIKKIALLSTSTVKDLLSVVNGECLYEVYLVDLSGKIVKTFSPFEVLNILSIRSPYERILQ